MRSRQIALLPGESVEDYQTRLATWQEELGATNDSQRFQVARAVRASWMLERADAVEDADGQIRVNSVVENRGSAELEEALALAARLDQDLTAARLLRRTPAGTRLVLAEWAVLRDHLVVFMGFLPTQMKRTLSLLGKRREDVLRDDPIALKWFRAQLAAVYGQGANAKTIAQALGVGDYPPKGMAEWELGRRIQQIAASLPDQAEAHALLKAYVAEAIAELEEHLVEVEVLAERDRALQAQAARVDRTVDGSRLTQYAQAQDRTLHAALRRLEALQNPRRPGREKGSANAAGTAAQDGGVAGSAVATPPTEAGGPRLEETPAGTVTADQPGLPEQPVEAAAEAGETSGVAASGPAVADRAGQPSSEPRQ
jgi:hypothetical protein